MFWSRFTTINSFKSWFWRNFSTCWNILNIITWKHYCYWNQTFWVWNRFKCIIKLSLPFPSTSGVPTHMKIKPGLSQRSDLLPMRRFHMLWENKRFQSVHLCLKAPENTKVRQYWRQNVNTEVLNALQLCV